MCALISAMKNKPVINNSIVFGEIGLSGEVRKVSRSDSRIKEAAKLGFNHVIVPEGTNIPDIPGLQVTQISHVKQLQDLF